jgi:hypothetical protein
MLWFLAGATSSFSIADEGATLIRGIGNSGNRIYNDSHQALADALVEGPLHAEVSQDTLATTWDAIQERARTGDPQAAAVVFAVSQRHARSSSKPKK